VPLRVGKEIQKMPRRQCMIARLQVCHSERSEESAVIRG
jgi:hypothetical protein